MKHQTVDCFPTDSGKVYMGQVVDIVTGHFPHEVGLVLVGASALEVVLKWEVALTLEVE